MNGRGANEAVDSWCRSDSRAFQVKSYLLLLKQVVRNPLIDNKDCKVGDSRQNSPEGNLFPFHLVVHMESTASQTAFIRVVFPIPPNIGGARDFYLRVHIPKDE
jgi:hypothetical protein